MSTQFPLEPSLHRWGSPVKPPILFIHANSYSAGLYKSFLEPLFTDFDILAPELPGHGRSRWNGTIQDWQEVADYYIAYFDRNPPTEPFIGMGHSIGAIVIMLMSFQRPQWFHKLVLLDPVMLPRRILFLIRILNLLSLSHLVPLARSAKRRKTRFPDRDAALQHYGRKKVFSRWKPEFLEAYVATCLYQTSTGDFQLACSPELESSIYQSLPLSVWSYPRKLSHPTLFIIGDHSDTVTARSVRRLQKTPRNHVVKGIAGGHLFPFEKPQETLALIKDFLR